MGDAEKLEFYCCHESVGRVVSGGDASGLRTGDRVFVPGSRGFVDVNGLFGGAAARKETIPAPPGIDLVDDENDVIDGRTDPGADLFVFVQTDSGEARRDDERFLHVAAWEFAGDGVEPRRHEEPLRYESVQPTERSYK